MPELSVVGGGGQPWTNPYRMPTGALAETLPSSGISLGSQNILVSQRVQVVGIMLRAGMTVTSISFVSGSQAAVGPTHQWFGLYTTARAQLATSADDTSTAWALNAVKTLSMTAAYAVPTSGLYYLAIEVTAGTVPNLNGVQLAGTSNALTPFHVASADTGVDTLPNPLAAFSQTSLVPHAYVS